jgi:hypothetical protein
MWMMYWREADVDQWRACRRTAVEDGDPIPEDLQVASANLLKSMRSFFQVLRSFGILQD